MDRTFRDVVRRSMSLAQLRSSPKPVSASEIRKTFVDYFCEDHEHLYIRSSPVFSLKDPTLAFTNAGMNQFKDVFLGLVEPASRRVANYQKCIRIGGTHNDLDQVGQDGSHHTFFEMLGNWSFGNYFKEEGCRLSWDLLTQVYGIPSERLYVTYFGGDAALGLSPDVEVQEIWRQIGVKESHILPFGAKHNFWSGYVTGPCGPCTEIHYDRVSGRTNAGNLVNSGTEEVTELWNLVFTQFDRKESGELTSLRTHFVDTGMGLERLVAVLQGKTSNYDTDLFLPLFEVIRKHTGHSGYTGLYDGNATDCGYRIVADHSRMIAVALSDGMIPNHQSKIRGIIRRTFNIIHKVFRAKPDLLKELSNKVAEILSDAYPNIGKNLSKIHYIIDSEVETVENNTSVALIQWKKLKKSYPALDINVSEYPQILTGLEYFSKNILGQGKGALSGEDVFVLYDTYGIPVHVTEQMALKLGLGFDMAAFLDYQHSTKTTLRENIHQQYKDARINASYVDIISKLEDKKIQPTFDYFKHDYRVNGDGKYVFPKQETTIEAILCGNELLDEISAEEMKGFRHFALSVTHLGKARMQSDGAPRVLPPVVARHLSGTKRFKTINRFYICFPEDQEVGLILDRTQLFSEEGGQASDCGTLEIEKEIIFDIKKLVKIKNFVIHFGVFRRFPRNSKVSVKNIGILHLDENRRIDIMRNHTALHLINAFLREEMAVTGEKLSLVTPERLLLKFMVYKNNLHSRDDIQKLEKFIKDFIVQGVSVKRSILNHPQFQALDDVVSIPGETILSQEIPVIEINSGFRLSREFCTGTHLLNTSDLKDFIVTKFLKGSHRLPKIEAVTGEKCAQIRKSDSEKLEKWSLLKNEVSESVQLHPSKVSNLESNVRKFLSEISQSEEISEVTRSVIATEISEAKRDLMSFQTLSIRNFLMNEIQKACQETTNGFVVLCVECSWKFNPSDLEAVATEFKDKPILVLFKHEDSVSIQSVVPQVFVSDTFSASHWLTESMFCVGGTGKCSLGQNPNLIFYLRNRKVSQPQLDQIMKTADRVAKKSFGC